MFIEATAKCVNTDFLVYHRKSAYISLYFHFVSTGIKKASIRSELLRSRMAFQSVDTDGLVNGGAVVHLSLIQMAGTAASLR